MTDQDKVQELHESSVRFMELLEECRQKYLAKQADYSGDEDPYQNYRKSENWGVPAWVACMVRVEDKVSRLQNLAQNRPLTTDTVQDAFLDIAVGALNAMVLWEETLPEDELDRTDQSQPLFEAQFMTKFRSQMQEILQRAANNRVEHAQTQVDDAIAAQTDDDSPPPTDEEILIHLQEQERDRLIEQGVDPEEATRAVYSDPGLPVSTTYPGPVRRLFRPEVKVHIGDPSQAIPEDQVKEALEPVEVVDLDEAEEGLTQELDRLQRVGRLDPDQDWVEEDQENMARLQEAADHARSHGRTGHRKASRYEKGSE